MTQKEAAEARNKFIDDNGLINHQKVIYTGEKVIMTEEQKKLIQKP